VNFANITLCVASQRMFIVASVYFVIDSVRKLLDTSSYIAFKIEMNNIKIKYLILILKATSEYFWMS
jgi:hypothetical protein